MNYILVGATVTGQKNPQHIARIFQHGVITFRLLYRMLDKILDEHAGIPFNARIVPFSFNKDTGLVEYDVTNIIGRADVRQVPVGQYMIVEISPEDVVTPAVVTLTKDVYVSRVDTTDGSSTNERRRSARTRALNRDLCDCATGAKFKYEVVWKRPDNTYKLYPGQEDGTAIIPANPSELGWAQAAHIFPLAQGTMWNYLKFNQDAEQDNGYHYTDNHIKNNNTTPVLISPDGLNSVSNVIIMGATQHSKWDSHLWTVDIDDGCRIIQLSEDLDTHLATNLYMPPLLASAATGVNPKFLNDHFKNACLKFVKIQ